MELWDKILVEWIKRTEFLNKCSEAVRDVDIDAFFDSYKNQIITESDTVCDFVKIKYPWFKIKFVETAGVEDTTEVHRDDYIFIYSLLLHHACIQFADQRMQKICSTMPDEFQRVMETFFCSLLGIDNFTLPVLRDVIENAEKSAAVEYNSSLVTLTTSPRTKLLDTFYTTNRNLDAQLEAERIDRQFEEIELGNRIEKLEEQLCASQALVKQLKKQMQATEDEKATDESIDTENKTKQLRHELLTKKNRLMDLQVVNLRSLSQKVTICEDQITYLNIEIRTQIQRNDKLDERTVLLQTEIEERTRMADYLNKQNSELEEIIRDLRSQHGGTLCDSFFDCSTTRNSSFSIPENVANIQLTDYQKQHQYLSKQIECIQDELYTTKDRLAITIEEREKLKEDILSMEAALQLERDARLNLGAVIGIQQFVCAQQTNQGKLESEFSEERERILQFIHQLTILKDEYGSLLNHDQEITPSLQGPDESCLSEKEKDVDVLNSDIRVESCEFIREVGKNKSDLSLNLLEEEACEVTSARQIVPSNGFKVKLQKNLELARNIVAHFKKKQYSYQGGNEDAFLELSSECAEFERIVEEMHMLYAPEEIHLIAELTAVQQKEAAARTDLEANKDQNNVLNDTNLCVISDLHEMLDAASQELSLKKKLEDDNEKLRTEARLVAAKYSQLEEQCALINNDLTELKRANLALSEEKATICERLQFEISLNEMQMEQISQFKEKIASIQGAIQQNKMLDRNLEDVLSKLSATKVNDNLSDSNQLSALQKFEDILYNQSQEIAKILSANRELGVIVSSLRTKIKTMEKNRLETEKKFIQEANKLISENRRGNEIKLEKMKYKMKIIHKKEMAKVKAKVMNETKHNIHYNTAVLKIKTKRTNM